MAEEKNVQLTLEEIQRNAKVLQEQKNAVPTKVAAVQEEAPRIAIRTYEEDMARAMNISDAKSVQTLLENARERQDEDELRIKHKKSRGWYVVGSLLLLIIAIGAAGYGMYHYQSLTVPVSQEVSVGVFPSIEPLTINTTTVEELITTITSQELPEKKPYLVPLVQDMQTGVLVSNAQLFSFLQSNPSEPLARSLSVVRLGVVNTGTQTEPFIITSVQDMDVALKELLLAEPLLSHMFSRTLGNANMTLPTETAFTGEYRYNLPIRTLYGTSESLERLPVLLYAQVSEHIIVITKNPEVIRLVYDSLLRQP